MNTFSALLKMFTKKSQLHNGFIEDNGGVNREAIEGFSTEILAIGDLKIWVKRFPQPF